MLVIKHGTSSSIRASMVAVHVSAMGCSPALRHVLRHKRRRVLRSVVRDARMRGERCKMAA